MRVLKHPLSHCRNHLLRGPAARAQKRGDIEKPSRASKGSWTCTRLDKPWSSFVISFIHHDCDALWERIKGFTSELFIVWCDWGLTDEDRDRRPSAQSTFEILDVPAPSFEVI